MAKKDRSAVARKAAKTKKDKQTQAKVFKSARNAKTFTKYKLHKMGYRYLDFDRPSGYEWQGIGDIVAVRRGRKNPDKFEILIIEVKGGKSKIRPEHMRRLRAAVARAKIDWNVAEKPGKSVTFKKPLQ